MKNFFLKITNLIKAHKLRSLLLLLALSYGGYYGYQKYLKPAAAIQYLTEAAAKSTITVAVTSSGQVTQANKIDLKPLGSGAIISTRVKNNDTVKQGQVIATIDQSSSRLAILQARASVQNAQANLDKLVSGATASDLKTAQNNINQTETAYKNALANLENGKQSAAADLDQAEKDLADLVSMNGLKRLTVISTIKDKILSARTWLDAANKIMNDDNAKDTLSIQDLVQLSLAKSHYAGALDLLDTADSSIATAQADPGDENIRRAGQDAANLLSETAATSNYLYLALQKTVTSSKLSQSALDGFKTTESGQISSANGALTAVQTAVQDLWDSINAAQNKVVSTRLAGEKEIAAANNQITSAYNSWQNALDTLAKLKTPAEKQDLASARAQIATAQAQLFDAENTFKNTVITAPFDGEVAALNVQKGDQANPSTVIATIITKQQLAAIALNEVDVAKIKLGLPATLSFDAVGGLTLTGKVAEIDTIGTVSQGVVTYNVKIVLDTQDARIKPGMSTNVNIITEVKTDALAVPNAAIKTDSGEYVEVLDQSGAPSRRPVTIGIANDSLTEIVSGINEGDRVVTQTINPNAAATAASQNASGRSGFSIPGLGR